MKFLPRILKQPLIHFLAFGSLLFVIHGQVSPGDPDSNPSRIVVDKLALLEFLQYRSRAFDSDKAEQRLAAIGGVERERLVQKFVREEILYREAKRLGLDRDDYVIKQRLVQKMEYLARGFGDAGATPNREEVSAYFEANRERYRELPRVTFAHVFLARDQDTETEQAAHLLKRKLNDQAVSLVQATRFGDRFLYHTNYVERDWEMIASHFGSGFVGQLFELAPDQDRWQGPIPSEHGYHLVMVVKRDAGGVPTLDSIYRRVAADAREARLDQQTEQVVRSLTEDYDVEVDMFLQTSVEMPASSDDRG